MSNKIVIDISTGIDAGMALSHTGMSIQSLINTLGRKIEIANAGHPWGNDELGKSVEKEYLGYAVQILDIWQRATTRVIDTGDGIVTAMRNHAASDQVSAEELALMKTREASVTARLQEL